jgi:transposase
VTVDLSASYAKAAREALPGAVLVADRYHLVQLANDMLTQVRQRVIRETQGRRGSKTDPAWAARRRLLTGHERLRPETFAKMWNSLIDTGDAGVHILQAYVVKEELRSLLLLAGTNPERHIIRTRLDSFYQQAAATDAPEAHRLAATIEAWWPAIEAGLLTGSSNSRSKATTAWQNTRAATLLGSATQSTNDDGYGGPVPASTGGPQPREARCPLKSEEPPPPSHRIKRSNATCRRHRANRWIEA